MILCFRQSSEFTIFPVSSVVTVYPVVSSTLVQQVLPCCASSVGMISNFSNSWSHCTLEAAITSLMFMQMFPPNRCLVCPKTFSSGCCEKTTGRTQPKRKLDKSSVAAAMLDFVVTTKVSAVNLISLWHRFLIPSHWHIPTTSLMDNNFLKLSQSNFYGSRMPSLSLM